MFPSWHQEFEFSGKAKSLLQLFRIFLFLEHTHTHPFNGPFSGTTRVSQYQKGKTNLDFTEARYSECQWHQLGHMQVCISLQTDNHASTPQLKFFYRPDALPATRPTVSKHRRHIFFSWNTTKMLFKQNFSFGCSQHSEKMHRNLLVSVVLRLPHP